MDNLKVGTFALGYSRKTKPVKAKQCKVKSLDKFDEAMESFYGMMLEHTDSLEEIGQGLSFVLDIGTEEFASTALDPRERGTFDPDDCLHAWEIVRQYL